MQIPRFSPFGALKSYLEALADTLSCLRNSGCEAYVVREGWEGLVRGNEESSHVPNDNATSPPLAGAPVDVNAPQRKGGFVATYGEGELLKEGEGEQTLKGRYIIRVRVLLRF